MAKKQSSGSASCRSGAEDAELVQAARAGDPTSFEGLVDRHMRPTYAVVWSLTGCRASTDDFVQEAFVLAHRKLDELREPERFGAWVAGIARRIVIQRQRVQKRRDEILVEYASQREREEFMETTLDSDRHDSVWSAVADLPESLRVPVILYYFEDESSAAVAERLDLPPATVRKRLQFARERLRDHLERGWARDAQQTKPSETLRRSILLGCAANLPPTGSDPVQSAPGSSLSPTTSHPGLLFCALVFCVLGALLIAGYYPSPADPSAEPDQAVSSRGQRASWSRSPATNTPVSPSARRPRPAPATLPARVREVLPPSQTLSGRLTDSRGTPLAGRTVFFCGNPQNWASALEGVTDGLGRFTIEGGRFGDYACFALDDDGDAYVSIEPARIRPTSLGQVNLVFPDGPGLGGRVVDDRGRPVAQAEVYLRCGEFLEQGAMSATSQHGTFDVSYLPSGHYQLFVRHPGYEPHLQDLVVPTKSVEIVLTQARELAVRIIGLEVRPGDLVCLSLARDRRTELGGGDDSTLPRSQEELWVEAECDPDGQVRFTSPPSGRWQVTFYRTWDHLSATLDIPKGVENPSVVLDVRGVCLQGGVAGSSPGDELVLTALSDCSPRARGRQQALDEWGKFTIENLAPARYLVSVRTPIRGWPADARQPHWTEYELGSIEILPGRDPAPLSLRLPNRLCAVPVSLPGEWDLNPAVRESVDVGVRIVSLDDSFPEQVAILGASDFPRDFLLAPGGYRVDFSSGADLQHSVELAVTWSGATTRAPDQESAAISSGRVFVPAYSSFLGWHYARWLVAESAVDPPEVQRAGPRSNP